MIQRENIALLLDDRDDSVSSQVTLSKTLRVQPIFGNVNTLLQSGISEARRM